MNGQTLYCTVTVMHNNVFAFIIIIIISFLLCKVASVIV